jgi:hypothetical protein
MHPAFRRLAFGGLVAVGGLCFAFLAPVIAAMFLLEVPDSSALSNVDELGNHFSSIHRARYIMIGLSLVGMAVSSGGIVYGLAAVAFCAPAPAPDCSVSSGPSAP